MPQAGRIPELDRLFEDVGAYRKSADYNELLNFIKQFPQLSPFNAMLVHVQKPGSEFVASAYEWAARYGRKPKPAARPLVILRPFGPVAFVFELNDTEGKPFPDKLQNPFMAYGKVNDGTIRKVQDSMQFEGISSSEGDYGTASAGFIRRANSRSVFDTQKYRLTYRIVFDMVINSNFDPAAQLATIFHELGHVFCGHIYHKEITWLPQRYELTKNEVEFEAESVCWILCERLGVNNPSAEYLSGYLNDHNEIPNISIDTVLKAAGIIERIHQGMSSPRKELILERIEREKANLT